MATPQAHWRHCGKHTRLRLMPGPVQRSVVPMLLGLLLLLAGACAPQQCVPPLLDGPGWSRTSVAAPLPVAGWLRGGGETLHAYIEGDGLAYINRNRVSPDPTPTVPTGFMLARQDASDAVAYLGRPCQYISGDQCQTVVWTTGRFSEQVLQSENQLLETLKQRAGASRIVLYGYSGGGGVAALLAARRSDVVGLVTVSGNLHHDIWTRHHKVTPLHASLDAISVAPRLTIPQVHYAGSEDTIVPEFVIRSFATKVPPGTPCRVEVVPGLSHDGYAWARAWPNLLVTPGMPPAPTGDGTGLK